LGIKNVKDLRVDNVAFELAMEIFQLTMDFPREEQYSLTDQIRRSSRSAAINIREGFAKRRYEKVFVRHLNDSMVRPKKQEVGWIFRLDAGISTRELTKGWINHTTKSMPCFIA